MKVCILLPSYNVAATLGRLLDALLLYNHALLVIDDGSVDQTSDIARQYADKGVSLLHHPVNRGKGAALRTGFAWALGNGFDVAVAMDSDLQHDPDDFPGMLKVFERENLDVLIGDRMHDQSAMPTARRLGNWFSSWGTGNFCHQKIFDAQCGFRVFRLAACRTMLSELTLDRYVSESEVLVRSSMNLLRIGFTPITVIYPEDLSHKSFYRPWLDTYRIVYYFTLELLRRTFTGKGRRELENLRKYVKSCSDWPRYYLLSGPGSK
ncbi:MAG: glycosyltransferase family 2 protein [Proteobacteria bacterium]|nr:glycosyltransferase family 2 protein [Pseudomonadota bacterium]MBU1639521.1 glycosyltransferase family 2 protein [Pseudomonadota bacterium]